MKILKDKDYKQLVDKIEKLENQYQTIVKRFGYYEELYFDLPKQIKEMIRELINTEVYLKYERLNEKILKCDIKRRIREDIDESLDKIIGPSNE